MKYPSIEKMKLADLVPADYNPREISDDALGGLGASIDRFGLVQPLVMNKRTGNLVGGHQRLRVLLDRKKRSVDVVVVNISEIEEKALNVTLNNPEIAGTFTDDLQEVLAELQEYDDQWMEELHLDALLDVPLQGPTPEENEIPALPSKAITKPGNVWLLGEHRLMCGSSTKHGDVMKLLGDRSAVCCWTDPPYGVDYVGKTKAAKTIKNDGKKGLRALLDGAFKLAFDHALDPGSAIYVAHPAKNAMQFHMALEASGFEMKQGLVWCKNVFALGHSDYHYRHEPIWYGLKPGEGRFGRGGSGWHGDNAQDSVFEIDKPNRNEEHPTMKPVALVAAMLVNSTKPLDWVYEPFCGSGTTLIACDQLKRRCLGMELDPLYCDVIVKRWESLTGGKASRKR